MFLTVNCEIIYANWATVRRSTWSLLYEVKCHGKGEVVKTNTSTILIVIYTGHTQKNGAVLIANTIETAPFFCVYPVHGSTAPCGPGPTLWGSSITDTPHWVGFLWANDRPIAETCTRQHSKETDIHAPGGIRTRNPRKRAAFFYTFSLINKNIYF